MAARETPTRLELHRLKYQHDGRRGPLLTVDSLEPEERDILSAAVFAAMQQNQGADKHVVYVDVLSQWGVMCSHPQHGRLYVGSVKSSVPMPNLKWYTCDYCGGYVINEEWLAAGRPK